MDNGGDEVGFTSTFSSSLIVSLNKRTLVASVVKRWIRPRFKQSIMRGNFQLLPNGNAFSAWSENCVISEHSGDGELLMEANFRSTRLVTYRTYKFNFTGLPSHPPDLRAFVYGTGPASSTTVFYVSWNGATEVAQWRFYSIVDGEEVILGSKMKTGFETMFQVSGYDQAVLVEAVGADGFSILGRSDVQAPAIMSEWERQAGDTRQFVNSTVGGGTHTVPFQQQDAIGLDSVLHLEPFQTYEAVIESNAALKPAEKTEL